MQATRALIIESTNHTMQCLSLKESSLCKLHLYVIKEQL